MKKTIQIISMLLFIIWSCEPIDEERIYEEKLTVFANLEADLPLAFDTVFVTYSHSINEKHEGNNKWVEDGTVMMIHEADTILFTEAEGKPGRYVTNNYSLIVQAGVRYTLYVSDGIDEIISETIVPSAIELESVSNDSLWRCGENTSVEPINIYPFGMDQLMAFYGGFGDSSIFKYDTVVYKEDDCYTSSFTSMPYFIVKWQSETEPGMMRNIMIAQDDSPSNFIMDTSFSAIAFKGTPFQDEDGNYYRPNPQVWNFSQQEIYFSWLAFNYYGLYLMIIQSTDQAFADYYKGDPISMNQYVLPESNIEGGYGLFTSTNSVAFFVYIVQEADGN
ncbi:MAG: DUF4249 family protein [Candidatus Marinimicrobia bacterium]|nr:DUF4249 family protein [Candidatus Neomarinimicrobiota bacterium]